MKSTPGLPQPFEVLFDSHEHKVVYCYECQLFHIHYGTVAIDLTDRELPRMIQTFKSYHQFYRGNMCPNRRCIEVETPTQGFRLLLSLTDLQEFRNMLEVAKAKFNERERQRRLN